MSGAHSDEKPLETSEKIRRTEIFVLGTFHATTLSFVSVVSDFAVSFLCRNPVNTLAISLSCDP